MCFYSTRGLRGVSLKDALISGIAPDGGLYLPEEVPQLAPSWRACDNFPDLAWRILRPFLRSDSLEPAVCDALNLTVPLVQLDGWEETYVLELFHGPTLSFKDFGARTMARLMENFVEGERITILVATSGDTGSAVADGFAGIPGLRVALLFPKGQVSDVQERQLTLKRPGVRAFAVPGPFDTCQKMVKEALATPEGLKLSAANSINVGRLLPQMLYYFWALVRGDWPEATFSVPCGNLGNLTAGLLASMSGLPTLRFLAAHNANRAFPRYLASGQYKPRGSVHTLSNAMDVGAPNNFERLRCLLPDMTQLITGYSVSDDETLTSMRRVFDETGYIADPHTAVGLEAVRRHRNSTGIHTPCVVLGTAHPAKFPRTVRRALGHRPPEPDSLARLKKMPSEVVPLKPCGARLMKALQIWNRSDDSF